MFATFAGAYSRRPNPGLDDVLASADARRADGSLDAAGHLLIADAFVAEILNEQEVVGLTIVGDGGVRAADRALPLIDGLTGTRRGDIATLPGGERATRPLVDGPVGWTAPITVSDWQFAEAHSDLIVKQTLIGPYSVAVLTEPSAGARREALALAFGEALNQEIHALAAVGCPMLEIDEPFALEIGDNAAEWRTFERANAALFAGLDPASSPHLSLGLWGGRIDPAGHRPLLELPYLSYLVDVLAGPSAWAFIRAIPPERGVIVGSADASTEAMDETEVHVWAMAWAAMGGRGADRVGCAPNGSLDRIGRHFAHRKCSRLGEAVNIARMGPLQEVAEALDENPLTSAMRELRELAESVAAAQTE